MSREAAYDGYEEVFTSGTDPSFTFDNTTQYITAGVGLRYKSFYLEHGIRAQNARKANTMHLQTTEMSYPPKASLTNNNNKLVFTLGYKFLIQHTSYNKGLCHFATYNPQKTKRRTGINRSGPKLKRNVTHRKTKRTSGTLLIGRPTLFSLQNRPGFAGVRADARRSPLHHSNYI